jgi:ethanolamine utilization microcompartment shell protein EutS
VDPNNPLFQAVIGPFVVAFLVIGSSRLVGWRTGSEVLAGLGVAAGLLMAFVQLRGIPSLPPNSAPEKLFYLITLAGLIGVALDLLGRPPLIGRLAFVLFPAICLAWFSLRLLLAQPDVGLLIKLAIMWAGAAIALWQICVANARGGALAGTILILATAVGAAGVAALAPFIGATLLCASVAAVAGALALWAYGVRLLVRAPMTIGATSLLGAAGGLVATVLLLVLFTASVSTAGAAFLIAVPFAGLVAEPLLLGGGIGRRVFGPVLLTVVAAVPAAGAIGLAYLTPSQ